MPQSHRGGVLNPSAVEAELARLRARVLELEAALPALAHQLRDVLSPLSNLLEVLRLKDPASEDLEWARLVLDRQVLNIGAAIDRLLSVAGVDAPASAAIGERSSDLHGDGALRVMIVDDNVDGADALAVMLRMYGHEVRTVYAGPDALEVGDAFEPHVVLLDLGMPDVDGYETCRDIKRRSWGDGARLVALTGWAELADRRRAADAGFEHYLVKPAHPDVLRQLLATMAPRRSG